MESARTSAAQHTTLGEYRHNYSAPDVAVCKCVRLCHMDNVSRVIEKDFAHLINERINGITPGRANNDPAAFSSRRLG